MDELKRMLEFASEFAELAFRDVGEIFPMWHCVTRDGNHFVSPSPADDKEAATAIMRAMFELRDVVSYIFTDEAWIVEARGERAAEKLEQWIDEHGHAKDHPDRVEVVMFIGETVAGTMSARRRIIRGRGEPRLGPLEIDNMSGVVSEGLFVGMLPRRNATIN